MSDLELTHQVQHHARERGPEALDFCRRELQAVEALSGKVLQAYNLSKVSAGVLLSREELERLLLGLASYHGDLETAVGDLEQEQKARES